VTARAIIVGNSPIYRDGVRRILQGGGYEVLGMYSPENIDTGGEAPDFVVILVDVPGVVIAVEDMGERGTEEEEQRILAVVGDLRDRFLGTKIVAYSAREESWADVTVPLTATPEQLVERVRRLLE